MKASRKTFCGLVFILLMFLPGCLAETLQVAPVFFGLGNLSGQQRAADQCTLQLSKPLSPAVFVEGAMAVGKDLGFEVNNVNRRSGEVRFLGGTGRFESAILGKSAHQMAFVSLQKGGMEVDISIEITGNFGKGTQEEVTKELGDFRKGLLEKFANN